MPHQGGKGRSHRRQGSQSRGARPEEAAPLPPEGRRWTMAVVLGVPEVDVAAALAEGYEAVGIERLLGFSNGGFMSYRMACSASRTFAAFAPVSTRRSTCGISCSMGHG